MENIILASGSLKRQEFFKLMGLPFSVMPADIDESIKNHAEGGLFTRELAEKKVKKVINDLKNSLPNWICAADTVIVCDEKIIGKQNSREEAAKILRELAGKRHKVITSVALYNGYNRKIDSLTNCCTVSFACMTDEEINWYLDTNEWQGAAGAYRIQGLAGCFIESVEGCPNTVAGLPLRGFYVMLRRNGYQFGA